jgi:hypothetical protein
LSELTSSGATDFFPFWLVSESESRRDFFFVEDVVGFAIGGAMAFLRIIGFSLFPDADHMLVPGFGHQS